MNLTPRWILFIGLFTVLPLAFVLIAIEHVLSPLSTFVRVRVLGRS